ncbi:MAG: hypothetical protein AB1742_02445 [bacterium]
MTKKHLADPAIRQWIYECASRPDDRSRVIFTSRAQKDMIETKITKYGVCEAICKWIEADKRIEVQKAVRQPFKGQLFFVMDSVTIDGKKIFVKVQFMGEIITGSTMKIVSAHRPRKA